MSEIEEVEPVAPRPQYTWKAAVIIGLCVLAVVAGIGAIGHISGTGWFGYRQVLYGGGELYILNLSDDERLVVVDGRAPVEVPAQNAQMVEIIGGTSQVIILDTAHQQVDSYEVTIDRSHALLNISQASCLVVADISSFYGGKAKKLAFVEFLREDRRVYVPNTTNVVWPRRSFPPRLDAQGGPGLWIEIVGCPLLDERDYLEAYMDVRLQQRFERKE
ncbi:MAG: hypothetical protein H0U74_20155 [Bradymonadaceae bacterium]|nr:hypothetical protein [Lujinxingiaceae bacterium]